MTERDGMVTEEKKERKVGGYASLVRKKNELDGWSGVGWEGAVVCGYGES